MKTSPSNYSNPSHSGRSTPAFDYANIYPTDGNNMGKSIPSPPSAAPGSMHPDDLSASLRHRLNPLPQDTANTTNYSNPKLGEDIPGDDIVEDDVDNQYDYNSI